MEDINKGLILIAGPCAVESEKQIMHIAENVKNCNIEFLRGGAWKPRTNAGEWEGMKEEGLKLLNKAKKEFGLKIVTEIMGPEDLVTNTGDLIKIFQDYGVDVYQVGARNAQNQALLYALKEAKVNVLLKNPMNSTVKEWIGSAGKLNQDKTWLCFRGKNNETDIARNGADLVTLVHAAQNIDYPIIFDPSHSAGKRELVFNMSNAAVAAGADGLIVEVHHHPIIAKTDGRQSITTNQLEYLVGSVRSIRASYLDNVSLYEKFAKDRITPYVDIYFDSSLAERINSILKEEDIKEYSRFKIKEKEFKVLTSRVPHSKMASLNIFPFYVGGFYVEKDPWFEVDIEKIKFEQNGSSIKISPIHLVDYNEVRTIRGGSGKGLRDSTSISAEYRYEFIGVHPDKVNDFFLSLHLGRLGILEPESLIVLYKDVNEKK